MGEFQTWGLKNGLLLHISQVQSGLACGCVCPNCKSTLIARKGRKNQHSFAHYIRAQSCGGGQETALHLMAKEIIAKNKKIYLPAEGTALSGRVETVDTVKLEVRDYKGFIPDIIVCKQNEALNIEIRVSHAVDDEKRAKIKTAGLRTVEIDLHDMLDDFSEESVAEAILSEERSTWVYNPAIEKEERAKQARKILCDYLPCEGRDRRRGEKVFCPLH